MEPTSISQRAGETVAAQATQEHKRASYSTGQPGVFTATHASTSTNVRPVEVATQRKHAMTKVEVNVGTEMTINQVQQEKGHESRKRRRTEADKKVVMTSAPKMSRHLLAAIRPSCQSALNTISAIPPPKHAMTQQEKELLKNLNMNVFKIKTPINVEMLRKLTIKHPNRPYVDYILDGLCNGFRYGYTMHRRQVIQNNLASIHLDIAAFRKAIAREVDLGRYAGPFDLSNPPCSTFMVNPCGLVPKKNTVPQEYRVINHQS